MLLPEAPAAGLLLSGDERARLLPSLSTRAQLAEVERLGLQAARVWVMRPAVLGRADLMSEAFARELHRRMFGAVWRGAGDYRRMPGPAGWEPAQIAEGMRVFLEDAGGWISHGVHAPRDAAVRLHYRLLAVRPWANGNGRHARLLADVLVAAHGEAPLTWGARSSGPAARAAYGLALAAADAGDLGPLLAFAGS